MQAIQKISLGFFLLTRNKNICIITGQLLFLLVISPKNKKAYYFSLHAYLS